MSASACRKNQFCPRMRALKSLFCLGLKVTASTWLRQKTLLSAQVCGLTAHRQTVRAAADAPSGNPRMGVFRRYEGCPFGQPSTIYLTEIMIPCIPCRLSKAPLPAQGQRLSPLLRKCSCTQAPLRSLRARRQVFCGSRRAKPQPCCRQP